MQFDNQMVEGESLLREQLLEARVDTDALSPEVKRLLEAVAMTYERFGSAASDLLPPNDIDLRDPAPVPLSERTFENMAQSSPIGIVYADADGTCVFANERATQLLGEHATDLLGRGWLPGLDSIEPHEVTPWLESVVAGQERDLAVEHQIHHPSGATIWATTTIAPVYGGGGSVITGWLAHVVDITERKHHEQELSRLAKRDSLTGLNNRYSLNLHLSEMVHRLRPHEYLAVAVMDLDRFKLVNDSFGHQAGDALLEGVARKLERIASPEDVVARLGGDEFAFVCVLDHPHDADALGAQLSRTIHGPLDCDGKLLHVGGSVGVAVARPGESRPEELMRNADTAMYEAKRSPASTVRVFDERFRAAAARRFQLEVDVRAAIDEQKFSLAFQPIVEPIGQGILGVEALVRLQDATGGPIAASDAVTVAEELDLITGLGDRVLHKALEQLRAWRKVSPALRHLVVSVNVSPLQLADNSFPYTVMAALATHDIPSSCLVLEVTEGAVIQNIERAQIVLESLRAMGVRVALDDFGTGYSSLAYLDRLPVDFLKIDKRFVRAIEDELGSSSRLAESIIDLALKFGMAPVAEGIENEAQRRLLIASGCELAQGHLFGGPMAPSDPTLRAMLRIGFDEVRVAS